MNKTVDDLTDRQMIQITGYFLNTGRCAYCNGDISSISKALDFCRHVLACIPKLEDENTESYKN